MSDSADVDSMGKFRFRKKMKGWQSVLITIILISGLFLQITKNTEATVAGSPDIIIGAVKSDSLASAAPEIPDEVIYKTVEATLRSGSTLGLLLEDEGISATDTSGVITAIKEVVNLRRLQAGQKVNLLYENNYFAGIMLPLSTDKDIYVSRTGGAGFQVTEKYRELTVYPSTFHAVVDSSLYASCLDSGMTDRVIMEMIELFSFDVDFQRDIQRGNELSVTYEVIYDEEGNAVDTGNILYTSLKTDIHDLKIYQYTDLDGKADYYNQDGQTVRKTLLKTPINGAYITSSYGPRVSPITGYNMVHRGVDFGAPRGTPIMSSGDGTVTYAGYNDVFGYHVRVRHVNGYETMYAHMTSFASGIRRGRVVSQGQRIGYVGSTGQSTGPHLHYEVRLNGTHINPSRMKFPPGRTLQGEEARLFANMLASYESSLN